MSAASPAAVPRVAPAPLAGLVLAVALLAMGAFICAIAVGWVVTEPGSRQTPPWVGLVCGGVFASGGVGVLATAFGYGRALAPAVAALVLAGLIVVCHWVAFAPGERRFTSTVYVAGLEVQRSEVDERTGRNAFAYATLSIDVLLAMIATGAWRSRRRAAEVQSETGRPGGGRVSVQGRPEGASRGS